MAAGVAPVISTECLNKQLKNRSSSVTVLDTTWFSSKDAMSEVFSKKHIMNASFFDLMFGVQNSKVYPRNLPSQRMFEINVRGSAVNTDSHVVLYDATGKCGFFTAGRVWWMFKLFGHENVSVLDGGLEKWVANGYETTNMSLKKREGDFSVKGINEVWIKRFDDMKDNLTSKNFQVCDSRTNELYKHGHYPGSVNIPFFSLMSEETRSLKSVSQLKNIFADTGIDLTKPIVTICNSGMSSCTLALVAHMCGCPHVAVYQGGITEWKFKGGPLLECEI